MSNAGELVSVAVGLIVILGVLWRFVVLPNLRDQLIRPLGEVRRQVIENHHAHVPPTILDRLDNIEGRLNDVAGSVDALALTQGAVLRNSGKLNRLENTLAEHLTTAADEGRRLWLLLESFMHEETTNQKGRHQHDGSGDTGGA